MNQNNNFCKNCGCQLNPNDRFCKNCGTAIDDQPVLNNNEQVVENSPIIPNSNLNNSFVAKKKNSGKYIVISLIVALLVGVGVYFLLIKDNNSNGINGNNKENNTSNGTNSNNKESNNSSTLKDVSYKGYTFKVPTNYEYKINDDTLSFGNKEDTWYAGFKVITSNYDVLVSSKSRVVSEIEASGYKVNTYDQKEYSGLNCIVMEVDGMGQKMLLAYVKITSSKVFVVSVLNLYKDYDYDLFAKTIEIISTAI